MNEIELKLIATEALEEDAIAQRVRTVATVADAASIEQEDTYLDTADGALARAGLSARVRDKKSGRSVDVKVVPIDAALVMRRAELSTPVGAGKSPGEALRDLLLREVNFDVHGDLEPRLVLRTLRVRREIQSEASSAELCFDRVGVFSAAPGPDEQPASTFVEIECELLEGDPALVHDVAAALDGLALEPSMRSKYLRAREACGLPGYGYGPSAPSVERTTSVGEVARAACERQLALMRAYEPGARVGLDTEHLHKMRVASRRLRTALKVFKGQLDPEHRAFLEPELRWIGRVLGEVRDLDVQILALDGWRARFGRAPAAGWRALTQRLEQRHTEARERLVAALDDTRWSRLCERASLAFSTERPGAETPAPAAGAKKLKKIGAKFIAGVARFEETHDPDDAHTLRILGKRLRYTAEFFKPLLGEASRASLGRLSAFQDDLGDLQDAVAAGEFARGEAGVGGEVSVEPALAFVLGELAGSAATSVGHARSRVDEALVALDANGLLDQLQCELVPSSA